MYSRREGEIQMLLLHHEHLKLTLGMQSLYYGFLDGATDWFTLPKKGFKKQGIWGLLKGIIQGLLNLGLKPAAGMLSSRWTVKGVDISD